MVWSELKKNMMIAVFISTIQCINLIQNLMTNSNPKSNIQKRDKGFDALQYVFIALQKLANRTQKKQLKKCVKTLIKAKI
jgi:hypothetical protein